MDMTIADVLVPMVKAMYPDRKPRFGSAPEPIVVFPAACPDVGDLSIYDDGEEATVAIENVTHHHVNNYDAELSQEERIRRIAQRVVTFLDSLFSDSVLLWSIDRGQRMGGWRLLPDDEEEIVDDLPDEADVFLWSQRLRGPITE